MPPPERIENYPDKHLLSGAVHKRRDTPFTVSESVKILAIAEGDGTGVGAGFGFGVDFGLALTAYPNRRSHLRYNQPYVTSMACTN